MGWKAFKEHFNIEHIVQVEEGKLYIGSPYLPRLVPIDMNTGKIIEKQDSIPFLKRNYPNVAEATPELIKDLIDRVDVFERSIVVYTFDCETYDIITRYCEALGYPNITHDGCLMHENEYFENRNDAVKEAKKTLASVIEWRSRRVQELEAEFLQAKAKLEYLKGVEIA